jgi:hypothetical protein
LWAFWAAGVECVLSCLVVLQDLNPTQQIYIAAQLSVKREMSNAKVCFFFLYSFYSSPTHTFAQAPVLGQYAKSCLFPN